jgi:hypothetical protein
MGLGMDTVGRLLVGCFHQAEGGSPRDVKPVGEELDAVAILYGKISLMGFRYLRRRRPVKFVSIDEVAPPVGVLYGKRWVRGGAPDLVLRFTKGQGYCVLLGSSAGLT